MSYVDDVQDVVKLIPRGRVSTYGTIADFLTLGSARMVGWALKQSVSLDQVPAHRVVNRKGELTGRNNFENPFYMEQKLREEGVEVKDNKVLKFDDLFWHPREILE